ncbi:hypothetical protein Tco_1229863 [Tanacetum coccineum]
MLLCLFLVSLPFHLNELHRQGRGGKHPKAHIGLDCVIKAWNDKYGDAPKGLGISSASSLFEDEITQS